jgi:hypothetical protein
MMLIKENTLLPETLRFESEPCVPGWRLVRNLDSHGLGRLVREAGWTLFCLAGEIRATAFGLDEEKTAHKAMKRVLARLASERFNSSEILRVVPVASKRFPGVCQVTVFARSRHIEEGTFQLHAQGIGGGHN